MEYTFKRSFEGSVQFLHNEGKLFLASLFGLECGNCRKPAGSSLFGGLFSLDTDYGEVNTDNMVLLECSCNDDELKAVWELEHSLQIQSLWSFCSNTGVLHRRDSLRNTGTGTVGIYSAKARFVFTPGSYEIYSQSSSWCNENQGIWQKIHHGSFHIECEGGRTTQGSTPFLVLKNGSTGRAVAFQLLPEGNWDIGARAMTGPGDSSHYMVVEAGMADRRFKISLAPGEVYRLPELLLYDAVAGTVSGNAVSDFNAWKLHTYYLKNIDGLRPGQSPVVYNTWFDVFELLDVSRLRMQVEVAKRLGCEVFVIDAGWYGIQAGDWFSQAGDWREKEHAAFFGRMSDFADEVRANGLGFGLWMEPERIGAGTPVRQQHPEWFIRGGNGFYYPDLTITEAYEHIMAEICRLIEKYRLVWMKMDFNFDLGTDKSGWELGKYYSAWYSLLDKVHEKYPEVFLEGCASGGIRLDLNTLRHHDGHFLSDNVNPWDVLSIYQGALLRLPPGPITKWAVMRPTGGNIVKYGLPLEVAPAGIITPEGATWERTSTVSAGFVLMTAMQGIMGLAGDYSGMDEKQLDYTASAISFYKQWRSFIRSSRAYLLTSPMEKGRRNGWAGMQLQSLDGNKNMVFLYRLEDSSDERYFCFQGLKEEGIYQIRKVGADWSTNDILKELTGEVLMHGGIPVKIGERNSACIYILEENSK